MLIYGSLEDTNWMYPVSAIIRVLACRGDRMRRAERKYKVDPFRLNQQKL